MFKFNCSRVGRCFPEQFLKILQFHSLSILIRFYYIKIFTKHDPFGDIHNFVNFANFFEGRIIAKLDLLFAVIGEYFL